MLPILIFSAIIVGALPLHLYDPWAVPSFPYFKHRMEKLTDEELESLLDQAIEAKENIKGLPEEDMYAFIEVDAYQKYQLSPFVSGSCLFTTFSISLICSSTVTPCICFNRFAFSISTSLIYKVNSLPSGRIVEILPSY